MSYILYIYIYIVIYFIIIHEINNVKDKVWVSVAYVNRYGMRSRTVVTLYQLVIILESGWRVAKRRVVTAIMSFWAISLSRQLQQARWPMRDNSSFRDVKAPWRVATLRDNASFSLLFLHNSGNIVWHSCIFFFVLKVPLSRQRASWPRNKVNMYV
jgi:hypothetical protein